MPDKDFQKQVDGWMLECFGQEVSSDSHERNLRFFEEAAELIQACGATRDMAHQMVDFVFNREPGDIAQEAGGVMVTLAALCTAHGIKLVDAAANELQDAQSKTLAIREKHARKPRF